MDVKDTLLDDRPEGAIPLVPVNESSLAAWARTAPTHARQWVEACGFTARAGTQCLIPGPDGALAAALAGTPATPEAWSLAALPTTLPEGSYFLECDWPPRLREQAAVGWALGAYRFERYRAEPESGRAPARLVLDSRCDGAAVRREVEAVSLVRDLVNTPAEDMMPGDLDDAAQALAARHAALASRLIGDDLLARGFPAVHAVGRASAHPPRLIELRWGAPDRPRVAVVGKGVCFDSGGLDIKNAAGMRLMKKDMGGAAHALGLAHLIMDAQLPVCLRVLIPAVENAIAGNALRPGDVVRSRKGLTIEIDNTDAEGRVILADALHEAGSDDPEVMVDFATLTGAARVALGTEVPALFCNDDRLADALARHAADEADPVWRLPLHAPYRELIESRVADIANGSSVPYAGAISAALFLESFVPEGTPWAHLDIMAWNRRARPGRPEGGEAMGLRAVYAVLRERYVLN